MSQALYRKWRPRTWDEVVGQPHVVRTLRNALQSDRVVHAYLFAGPRGTGKTTVARLLAKAVNCLGPAQQERPCNSCAHCQAVNEGRFLDLIEIDAASHTSVEDVRELQDKLGFAPSQGRYRVYLVDEVHMLSTSAFNALLKTLEEPPSHVIFILATTEVHKIPPTVLSRCQRHEFRRIPVQEIVRQLQAIVTREGLEAEPEALTLIARQSTGSLRDAISLLDQMAAGGQVVTLALVQTLLGTATSATVVNVVQSVIDGDAAAGLNAIHRALDAGTDPRALARQLVEYLRQVLLVQYGNLDQVDATAELRQSLQAHAGALSNDEVLRMIRLFNAVAADTRGGWQPALGLELALAEMLPAVSRPAVPPVADVARYPAPRPDSPTPVVSSPPAAPARTLPAVDLGVIQREWKRIARSVASHNSPLSGLLGSSKVLGTRDGFLILGLKSDVLVSKFNAEMREQASAAIRAVTGIDVPVQCIQFDKDKSLPPDISQDGMVATALQEGGEIVDIQD